MGADLSHFPTSIDSDRLGYIHTAVVLQKKITFFSTLFSRLNCFEKKKMFVYIPKRRHCINNNSKTSYCRP